VFVLDTSAFLNGWRDHYPPTTFPGVWTLIDDALHDGRAIAPREVYGELTAKDDDVATWAKARPEGFVDPSEDVQRVAGVIYMSFPQGVLRNAADPWVIAEARMRRWTVVTYEGRTFAGVPTRNWHRSMPGICQHHSVACITLPEALGELGGSFA
jgi:hypothetical protein